MKLFASVAAAALIASVAVAPVYAAQVEVNLANTNISQMKNSPTSQIADAIVQVNGEIRDTSEATATAVAGVNLADIEQTVADSDADASFTGSLGLNLSGSSSEMGNTAWSDLGNEAESASGFGLSSASSSAYAEAATSAWDNDAGFTGAMNVNFSYDLPSYDNDTSMLNVNQTITDSLSQDTYASLTSGGVYNNSVAGASALDLGNQLSVSVHVGCPTC